MSASAAREQRRWLVALGTPLVVASASVATAFATAGGAGWTDWFFAPAVLLAPIWITTLALLALRSDTNGAAVPAEGAICQLQQAETELRRAA
jgi:hypothetical protein